MVARYDEAGPDSVVLTQVSLMRRVGGRLIDLAAAMSAGLFMSAAVASSGAPEVAGMALGVLVASAIQAMLISTRGQSLGKIAMRTMMVDSDGRRVGLVRGFIMRELPMLIFRVLPLFRVLLVIDGAFILRDDTRCLHDHFAGTFVVRAPSE